FVAVLGGLIVGTIALLLRRVRTSTRLFELAAALGAALVIYSCERWIGGFNEWIPMAAGLIVLLPGVSLVDGVNELANGHLLAGGTRMAGVAVAFLAIAFGTVVGITLAHVTPSIHVADALHGDLPQWAPVAAVMVVGVGSLIRFRACPSSLLAIILSSAAALTASRVGRQIFGDLSGAFIAALTLGLLGQLYSYCCRHAAEVFTIPGVAVLVPGSMGVRSMRSLLDNETNLGIEEGFQMLLIAMALAAELLFAGSIWQAARTIGWKRYAITTPVPFDILTPESRKAFGAGKL
ncbi:MAG TPA: threonine/serine exporter family protein, partial [Pirellulales bacterium]|nr:threonine/serine exporter family protein [Pirellulales bacterium]